MRNERTVCAAANERNRRNLIPPCRHRELQAIRAVGRAGDPLKRMHRQNEFFKGALTEPDESRNALFQELNVGRMGSNHSFDCTSGLSLSKLRATTAAHSPMHCLRRPACLAVPFASSPLGLLRRRPKASLPPTGSWSIILSLLIPNVSAEWRMIETYGWEMVDVSGEEPWISLRKMQPLI